MLLLFHMLLVFSFRPLRHSGLAIFHQIFYFYLDFHCLLLLKTRWLSSTRTFAQLLLIVAVLGWHHQSQSILEVLFLLDLLLVTVILLPIKFSFLVSYYMLNACMGPQWLLYFSCHRSTSGIHCWIATRLISESNTNPN